MGGLTARCFPDLQRWRERVSRLRALSSIRGRDTELPKTDALMDKQGALKGFVGRKHMGQRWEVRSCGDIIATHM